MAIAARRGAKLPRAAAGRHESEHGPQRCQPAASAGGLTRQQQVVKAPEGERFSRPARKTHDVAVFQFAEGLKQDRVVRSASSVPRCRFRGRGAAGQPTPRMAPRSGDPGRAAETVPRLGQAVARPPARKRGSARPSAVDSRGARHARLGHGRVERRRSERGHLARRGRRVGPRGEDSHLHRRPRFRSAADQRGGVRPGACRRGPIPATITP